ncbi:transporter substrate-binding domain-containing protein [Rugamonas sp. A1-17]|nr:transporter substrate-binding domain-containing protein [Rugamonas sp. A1-17]
MNALGNAPASRAMRRLRALALGLAALGLCGAAWAQDGPKARPAAASAPASDAARSPLVKMADGRLLAPDIARIVNRGEVVVAMLAEDNPPFFSRKNGELVGTDIDLANQIGRELGVTVRYDRSAKTFDAVAEMVAAGQADLGISRLARTLKRAQSLHFSNTYLRLPHALLINRVRFAELAGDRPLPQVVRDYAGTLGVLGASSWEEFGRRNFPKAKLVSYANWTDAVEAVKKGEVIAVYRGELEVMQLFKDDPSLALTLRTVTFSDLESLLSILVGVRDPTLLSFVNELIVQRPVRPPPGSGLKPAQ